MHRLLKPTGSLYLHCDWHASHYLKEMLDGVFGASAFKNEIVWHYGGRGAKAVAHQFPRNHDILLFYAKDKSKAFFEHQYTLRKMTPEEARKRGHRRDVSGQWFKTAPRGDYTDESIRRLQAEGRIYRTRTGTPRIMYPLEFRDGFVLEPVLVGDTWFDIPDAMHMGGEWLGYPTQKPKALLRRTISASCPTGGDRP